MAGAQGRRRKGQQREKSFLWGLVGDLQKWCWPSFCVSVWVLSLTHCSTEHGPPFFSLKTITRGAWDESQIRLSESRPCGLRGPGPNAHVLTAPLSREGGDLVPAGSQWPCHTAHVPGPPETHLDRAIAQEVQVHVLSKEVTFRVRGVEFLTSHEKVRCEVVSWLKKKRRRGCRQ